MATLTNARRQLISIKINALSGAVATTLARIKRFIKDPQFEESPTNIKDAISLVKSLKNDKLERNFLCLEKLISEGGDIKSGQLKIHGNIEI